MKILRLFVGSFRNRVFSSATMQLIGYFVGLASTFLLTPYIIRILGDRDYGLWILIGTITSYFALSEFGISSAVKNHLAIKLGNRDESGFKTIFSNAVILNVLIFCLVTILIALASLIMFLYRGRISNADIIIMVFFICGMNIAISFLFFPYNSVIASQVRFDIIACISIFNVIIQSVLIYLVLRLGHGLVAMAIVCLAVGLASNILTFVEAKRLVNRLRFNASLINRKDIKSLLSYSSKTFLAQLADIFRFKTDEVVTASFLSVDLVPHYSVGNRIATLSFGAVTRIFGYLDTQFAQYVGRRDKERLRKLFIITTTLITLLSVFIFANLALFGKSFIEVWLGKDYTDAYTPMLLLAGGYLISMSQLPSISYLYAMNKHQYFALMSFAEGIANLGLSILFVTKFKLGLNGVALGTLIPIALTKVIIQPMLVARIMKERVSTYYFLWAKLMIVSAALYAGYYGLIKSINFNSYWKMLLGIIFSLFLLLLLIRAFLKPSDLKEIGASVLSYRHIHQEEG